jgi:hypothetical protein
MPDPTISDQQVSDTGNPGQPENWKARYDGLVRKVEQLTLANRDLVTQLDTRASETEQFRSQLSIKDVEKLAAVGERDKKIAELFTAQTSQNSELNELKSLKLKIDVINKMGRPDLLRIADKLPAMTDPEAMQAIFADMASFADAAADGRERQLKSGMTLSPSGPQKTQVAMASHEAWNKHIDSLPLGTEREKARDEYWTWASNQSV